MFGAGLEGLDHVAQVLGQQALRQGLVVDRSVLHGKTAQAQTLVRAVQEHGFGRARAQIYGQNLVAPALVEKRKCHGSSWHYLPGKCKAAK